MVKKEWPKTYYPFEVPPAWDFVFQSWDTANKPGELSDPSVCTTWGVLGGHLYLLDVLCERLDYPALKRAVRQPMERFRASTVLIEDKASGTQLIQELVYEGLHAIKGYEPTMDKIMRLHSVCSTIENGFVHVPEKALYLSAYVHELTSFPAP
jgi:predicted phage terminase large subunit-like protein